MSAIRHYTGFKIFRIRTATQHIGVIVTFKHQICGTADIKVGAISDTAGVSGDNNTTPGTLDTESYIIGSVVTCFKRRNGQRSDRERKLLIDSAMVVGHTARHIMTPENTVKRAGSGVKTHVAVSSQQRIGIAHMVAVVVCKKYPAYSSGIDRICGKLLHDIIVVDSGIDKHSAGPGAYI